MVSVLRKEGKTVIRRHTTILNMYNFAALFCVLAKVYCAVGCGWHRCHIVVMVSNLRETLRSSVAPMYSARRKYTEKTI